MEYARCATNGKHLDLLKRFHDDTGADTVCFGGGLLSHLLNFWFTTTRDPKVVEHMLKTKFHKYEKGPDFHYAMQDLLGNGIFNVDGQLWHEQRKTASRMFTGKQFENHIWNCVSRHSTRLVTLLSAQEGRQVDIFNWFNRFTLDSIGEIGFGRNINSLEDSSVPFLRSFDRAQQVFSIRFVNPMWQVVRMTGAFGEGEVREHLKRLDSYSRDTVRLLKEQLDTEGEHNSNFVSLFIRSAKKDNKTYSDDFLRDLVLNFLIAGRDTTAQGLSWAVFLLMQHREVEDMLIAEIKSVVGDGPVTYKHLEQLTYTQAVINEALRLYPSVPRDPKFLAEDDEIPGVGHFPRGSLLMYLPHAMGRSTKIWGDDAEQFRPDRWIGKPFPSFFEYPVFQAGDRICLGMRLAWLEMKACLATLAPKLRFEFVGPVEDVIVDHSLTNGMMNGFPVNVALR
mmetsp:Transcript_97063/g.222451  ORF Transcript_97063/g.222451 Transcript_97063/m.222451 type:complete len:451 (-) Transcript_97063:209-1561(-)